MNRNRVSPHARANGLLEFGLGPIARIDGGKMHRAFAAGMGVLLSLAAPVVGAETPKRGGTLTYMIPADAPPSFDAHRETTYATIHTAAPFYSVLIRVPPDT